MATGIYHKHNVLKMRIMQLLLFAGKPLTCREIADKLGSTPANISVMMSSYQKRRENKYFRKLKPQHNGAYRYKITKIGMKYLQKYCWRYHEGFSLSLYKTKTTPKYDRIMAERKAAAAWRQAELDRTGVEIPRPPKPTLKELILFDQAGLVEYMGITKQGALEMGITSIEIS